MTKSEKTIKKILDKPYYKDEKNIENLQSILDRLYWTDRRFAISRIRTDRILFQALQAIKELILKKMPEKKLRVMDYNQAIEDMRKAIKEL